MKLQKLFIFSLFVVISLTLLGCSSSSTSTNSQTQIESSNPSIADNSIDTSAQVKNWTTQESDTWGIQRFTSNQIVYAAKVWDSIEAHPAHLIVTVELDDDIITAVQLDQIHSSPKSQRHQAWFARQIEAEVVGKKLSESDDVYLSVASSTSWAFNDAITQIQEQFQQS